MTRRCGYCRDFGHTANKCGIRLEQIEAICTHIREERKAFHDLMMMNGLGVGALIESGGGHIMMVRSVKPLIQDYANNFVDYKKVKYHRQAISILRSYTGRKHHKTGESDNHLIRFSPSGQFYIPASPMNDLSYQSYVLASTKSLPHPPADNPFSRSDYGSYYGSRTLTIHSPSNETDVVEEDFHHPHRVSHYIGKDRMGGGAIIRP